MKTYEVAGQTPAESAQPCGCDPAAHHTCGWHTAVITDTYSSPKDFMGLAPEVNGQRSEFLTGMSIGSVPAGNPAPIRSFDSGASRDVDTSKYDYEGFLNPLALQAFGAYMHKHRQIADGSLRASDNWQKGIPQDVYMKSLVRHTVDLWATHRGYTCRSEPFPEDMDATALCCAIIFNAMGYLKELLDPAEINLDKS